MFYTSKEMDDPLNGRFWTLTLDGDVYPDTLFVPSANRVSVARGEEQTCSDDNDACGPPLGAGLWIRSSDKNFLPHSHCEGGFRGSRNGGRVRRGKDSCDSRGLNTFDYTSLFTGVPN